VSVSLTRFYTTFGLFKVCKSVHHHTIQINHRLDAIISPVYYLTFIYSSTCFGRPHAHHQKLNNCSSSFWVYLRSVVIAVLLVVVVVGPAAPPAPHIYVTAIRTNYSEHLLPKSLSPSNHLNYLLLLSFSKTTGMVATDGRNVKAG
jgi:hypothetical protein